MSSTGGPSLKRLQKRAAKFNWAIYNTLSLEHYAPPHQMTLSRSTALGYVIVNLSHPHFIVGAGRVLTDIDHIIFGHEMQLRHAKKASEEMDAIEKGQTHV